MAEMRRGRSARTPIEWAGTLMVSVLFVVMLLGSFTLGRLGLGSEVRLAYPATVLASLLIIPVWFSCLRSVKPRPQPWRYLFVLFLLIGALIASWGWGTPGIGTPDLIMSLTAMAAMLLLTALAVSLGPEAVGMRVVWLFAIVGVAYAVLGIAGGVGEDRMSVLGGGPNVFGRMVAVGLVALLWLILSGHLPVAAGLIAPLLIATLALSGSRGSMLAGVVGMVYLALVARVGGRRIISGLAVLALLTMAALQFTAIGNRVTDVIQVRVFKLTIEDRYGSGREGLFGTAVDLFQQNPILGSGLGTFTDVIGRETYPHNIVLSVLAAVGILGGIMLVYLLLPLIRLPFQKNKPPMLPPLLAIAMTLLVSASFSGGLYDSRFLWFTLLIAVTVAAPDSAQQRVGRGSESATRRSHAAPVYSRPAPNAKAPSVALTPATTDSGVSSYSR